MRPVSRLPSTSIRFSSSCPRITCKYKVHFSMLSVHIYGCLRSRLSSSCPRIACNKASRQYQHIVGTNQYIVSTTAIYQHICCPLCQHTLSFSSTLLGGPLKTAMGDDHPMFPTTLWGAGRQSIAPSTQSPLAGDTVVTSIYGSLDNSTGSIAYQPPRGSTHSLTHTDPLGVNLQRHTGCR